MSLAFAGDVTKFPDMLNEAKCLRPRGRGRGQNIEIEAEFIEAEQNIIFHSENICCRNTAQSSVSSVLLYAIWKVTVRIPVVWVQQQNAYSFTTEQSES